MLVEEEGNKYFPLSCIELKEHNKEINENKPRKWMKVDIKTKEIDIYNDIKS